MTTTSYASHRLDLIPGAGFQAWPADPSRPPARLRRPGAGVAAPLGRERQIALTLEALARGQVVNVRGPCGIGKSTLLRHLAAVAGAALPAVPGPAFSDSALFDDSAFLDDPTFLGGLTLPGGPSRPHAFAGSRGGSTRVRPGVYLQVSADDDPADVVEAVLDNLGYPGRPEALATLRPVVALDCDAGGAAGVEALRPHCAVIVGSEQPITGVPCELPGLAEDDALLLLTRELGHDLNAFERMAAARLVVAVDGSPLRLRQAAAVVRAGLRTLEDLADVVTRDPAALTRMTLLGLDRADRGALTVLGVLAGMHLPADLVEIITDTGNTRAALLKLRDRRLVDAECDRFGLPVCRAPENAALLFRTIDLSSAVRDIAEFVHEADLNADGTITLAKALVTLTGELARRRQWTAVVTLVEAAEPILTVAGRWSTCQRLLSLGIKGAQHAGDLASEALFHHEQGTLALASGDHAQAREQLTQAHDQRARLGDTQGMEVSAHNLGLVPAIPAADDERGDDSGERGRSGVNRAREGSPWAPAARVGPVSGAEAATPEPPAPRPAKQRGRLKAAAGTLIAVVILGLGVVDALWDTSEDAKGSAAPATSAGPTATATPTPTTAAPTTATQAPFTRAPFTQQPFTRAPFTQAPFVTPPPPTTPVPTPSRREPPPVTSPPTPGTSSPPPKLPALAPDGLDFGEVQVGESSGQRLLVLRNDQDVPAVYGKPTVTDPAFVVPASDPCAGVVLPHSSCTFAIAFAPTVPGVVRAAVQIPMTTFPDVRSSLVATGYWEFTVNVLTSQGRVTMTSPVQACAKTECVFRATRTPVELRAEDCTRCRVTWLNCVQSEDHRTCRADLKAGLQVFAGFAGPQTGPD
ncbi:hypothetical protein [Paractinoplanes lichenicola]|uniref:EF-hand domain-containing protein n=1 Tax=Paractinoplanes lichenicola TaxID=2802976 RepID=A0ABS1VVV1_9ACTN|nr:hypothetical protein [Actinoplanes lichenicola]MBL7258599.1 hypothetical protein [Actinoplanes lichenicola]